MNKALVIYDFTGKIWAIYYGETNRPQGLLSIEVDIPEGATLLRIDLSDPKHPQPIFDEYPRTDLDKLKEELEDTKKALAEALDELNGRVLTLEGDSISE